MELQLLYEQRYLLNHLDFSRAERTILCELDFSLLHEGVGSVEIRLVAHCVRSLLED